MALNIPMPGLSGDTLLKGLDTGSSMFTRIMNPILERERQKQAQAQFEKELELKKQQEARMNANMGLNRQILQERLLGLQHQNDPNYQFEQFRALQDKLIGGMGQNMPQEPMPQQEMGEGMGMFSPEGLKQAQERPAPASQQQGGLNMEAIKNNPMLRGWFKHQFGYDPLAEAPMTTQEKQEAALNLFKQKEDIKKQSKGGEVPTNTVLTQNQQALQGINTVLPMLNDMIEHPEKVYGPSDFNRSKRAAYNAKTSGMIDTLIAAQQLPKVQASIDLVEQQIRRGTGESTSAYIERLKELRNDLSLRKGKAQSVLKSRKINTENEEDISKMSDEQLRQIAGGG